MGAYCPTSGKCRWTASTSKTMFDKTYESCKSKTALTEPKQCGFDFALASADAAKANKVMDDNKELNEKRNAESKAEIDKKAADKRRLQRSLWPKMVLMLTRISSKRSTDYFS